MKQIKQIYNAKYRALIISKTITKSIGQLPNIKKITFFFIINTKSYKKNMLLLYIVLTIFLGGIGFFKKKTINSLIIIEVTIKKNIFEYLQRLVMFYLPLLTTGENKIKKFNFKTTEVKRKNIQVFQINYLAFPNISELDSIYEQQELTYNLISNYRFQIYFFMQQGFTKYSALFLPRMYKLPYDLNLTSLK